MRFDVVVCGAGIVGTSVALHLAARGVAVALVDRREPGSETSYGNSGVIEGSFVLPAPFPRDVPTLIRAALKRLPEANYHLTALPALAPFLWAYFSASRRDRLEASGRALRPLTRHAVDEHRKLVKESGAGALWREGGWLKLYRTAEGFAGIARMLDLARDYGIPHDVLDRAGVTALEPSLAPVAHRAVHWKGSATTPDPGGLVKAYAALAARKGVRILSGDARTLVKTASGFRIDTLEGPVDAERAVLALGPWSPDLADRFGYRVPFAVKRGYHRHFEATGNARLARPVLDAERGYVLCPMNQGLRITTGSEFAFRDAPKTPVQLAMVEPAARGLFPGLGAPVENANEPWLGARPALPDSLPVIDEAPDAPGLMLAFGHTHWGFTLGPVTGRVVAEMMTGETPLVDPAPYRLSRFS